MNIKLILPTVKDKQQILDYKDDFIRNGDSLDGCAGLDKAETFEEWFDAFSDNLSEETVREGLVPATTFLAVDENENLLGMIDIRHRLNDYLLNFGGHIGYSVLKAHRRKGIATKMLSLALDECIKLGITKVLITCDKNNIASAKTIERNNGILENEVENNDRITKRYWINL